MNRLLVEAPAERVPERRYACEVVLRRWLGVDFDLVVQEGLDETRIMFPGSPGAITVPDVFLALPADAWMTPRSIPPLPLAVGVGPEAGVPVLWGRPRREGADPVDGSTGTSLTIDIFGSAVFLLTRYDERVVDTRDTHGRVPAQAQLLVRAGLAERPILDEYVGILRSEIERLWPDLLPPRTPFVLEPTHDVDQPYATWRRPVAEVARSMMADVLRRRDPWLSVRRARALLDARRGRLDRDPFATYDLLMDASERSGLKSTFYFLAGNEPGDADFRYRIDDEPILALLRRIDERGHGIGLHGSYQSHASADRLRLELDALVSACRSIGIEQPRWGVRQHYLRFEPATTWRCQEAAGFAWDSTVGHAELVGFRSGTANAHPVFDLDTHRMLDLEERPLLVMDGSLYEYLGLTNDQAVARALMVLRRARSGSSLGVLLVHNNSIPLFGIYDRYASLIAEAARP